MKREKGPGPAVSSALVSESIIVIDDAVEAPVSFVSAKIRHHRLNIQAISKSSEPALTTSAKRANLFTVCRAAQTFSHPGNNNKCQACDGTARRAEAPQALKVPRQEEILGCI